jgi:hypothetical protein
VKKLLDQIVREFETQLEQSQARYAKLREELIAKIKANDTVIPDIQEKLRKTNMRVDLSPDARTVAELKLEQERQSLAIDLAGMEARQEALQRTIAEQSNLTMTHVQADPIATELQTLVKVREQQMDKLKAQYAAGLAPSADLSTAAVAMAEAKAKLLERQELVKMRVGGEMVTAWNRELLNLSIDRAEKTAKAKYIEKELHAFRDVDAILTTMSERQEQRQAVQRELENVQTQISALESQPRPTVTVN